MWRTYWLPRYFYLLIVAICVLLIGWVGYTHTRQPDLGFTWSLSDGLIHEVEPNSPAANILEPGMRIQRLDDTPVAAARLAAGYQIGEDITIYYLDTDGQTQTLTFTLPAPAYVSLFTPLVSIITALGFYLSGSAIIFFSRRDQQTTTHVIFFLFSMVYSIVIAFGSVSAYAPGWTVYSFHIFTWWAGSLIVYLHLYFPIPYLDIQRRKTTTRTLIATGIFGTLVTLFAGDITTSTTYMLLAQLRYSWLALCFLGAAGLLGHKYLDADDEEVRQQIRLVTLGGVTAIMSFAVFFALPSVLLGYSLLPVSVILLLLLLIPASYTYGSFTQNLLELDETVNSSIAFLTKIFIISGICIVLYALVVSTAGALQQNTGVAGLVMAPVCGLLTIPLYRHVSRWVDQMFYGQWYDYHRVLQRVHQPYTQYSTSRRITVFLERLHSLIRFDQTALLVIQENETVGVIVTAHRDGRTSQHFQWDEQSYLWHYLRRLPESNFNHQQARRTLLRQNPEDRLLRDFLDNNFRFWVPLTRHSRSVGALIVGNKSGFDDLNSYDQELLRTLADYAEMFIYNTLLLQKVRRSMIENIRSNQKNLSIREDERKRIARDLHDDIIQKLVGLNYTLDYQDWSENGRPIIDSLKHFVKEDVREVIRELRTVCSDLRPPTLDDFGLIAAMRSRVRAAEVKGDFTVDTEFSGSDEYVPERIAISAVRVLQESLYNIHKHAGASHVKVIMTINNRELSLQIIDDGCGFEIPEPLNSLLHDDHFGIVGMKERVEAFNGDLMFQSKPGEGTVVSIHLPFIPEIQYHQ